MNKANEVLCRCNPCPGSDCTCGCQKPVEQSVCACGPQCRCGEACAWTCDDDHRCHRFDSGIPGAGRGDRRPEHCRCHRKTAGGQHLGAEHDTSAFALTAGSIVVAATNWLAVWRHETVEIPVAVGFDEIFGGTRGGCLVQDRSIWSAGDECQRLRAFPSRPDHRD